MCLISAKTENQSLNYYTDRIMVQELKGVYECYEFEIRIFAVKAVIIASTQIGGPSQVEEKVTGHGDFKTQRSACGS